MPTATVLPCSVRGLFQLGFASLIAGMAFLPVACSEPLPRGIRAPGAATRGDGPVRPVALGSLQPRTPNWILVQLRRCVVSPSAFDPADGSPGELVTIFASLESDPWCELSRPRELTIVVPSATALHGIDLVVQLCEVQVDLGAVSCVDGAVVRDPQRFAHEHGDLPGPSLLVPLPQP